MYIGKGKVARMFNYVGHHQDIWGSYIVYNAIPLQSWTGLEVSGTLRLPDLKKIGTCRL
jgi:hypothetical protein